MKLPIPPTRSPTATALGLCTAAALLAGCAQHQLVPAPQAQPAPGLQRAAVAQNSDVHMVVQAGAWSGNPDRLADELTPLKVSIENRGNQPVRVSYADFALDTDRGIRYSPLPPLRIEGKVRQTADEPVCLPRGAIHPRFGYTGFYLAPWYGVYYPGLRHWPHPWAFNRAYYDTYYPQWTVRLPTQDMLERAIPEGVLEPGGSVSGFLYFPELAEQIDRVTFRAELMQGEDGRRLGALQVPFQVQ